MSRAVKANDAIGLWEVFDDAECEILLAQFESESWAHEFAAAPDLLAALIDAREELSRIAINQQGIS